MVKPNLSTWDKVNHLLAATAHVCCQKAQCKRAVRSERRDFRRWKKPCCDRNVGNGRQWYQSCILQIKNTDTINRYSSNCEGLTKVGVGKVAVVLDHSICDSRKPCLTTQAHEFYYPSQRNHDGSDQESCRCRQCGGLTK
jgi:hypothetical protein